MNATAIGTATRAAGLALVLVFAAAFGLIVGNALQGRADGNAGPNIGGMVPENPGGTAVNARAASTSFSMDAVEAIQAIRDRAAAPADYADYGLRHPASEADADAGADAAKKSLAKPTLR